MHGAHGLCTQPEPWHWGEELGPDSQHGSGAASTAQGVTSTAQGLPAQLRGFASMAGHLCWDGDSGTSSGRRAPTATPRPHEPSLLLGLLHPRVFLHFRLCQPREMPAFDFIVSLYAYCITKFLLYHRISTISLYFYRDRVFLKPEVLRTTPIIHFTSPILVE